MVNMNKEVQSSDSNSQNGNTECISTTVNENEVAAKTSKLDISCDDITEENTSERESTNENTENPSCEKSLAAGSSSVSPENIEKDKEKAQTLFAQGKRHFIVNDIEAAVNAFQESTELFAKVYGEMGFEMADPYFYYGKALLEMARAESNVLGNDVQEDEDDDNEEEQEESIIQEENENMEEDNQEVDEDNQEVDEDNQEADEDNQEADSGKQNEDDDDVGNLQLSWEVFELAKVIYQKQVDDNPDMKLKIAQVYLKLGEVGLENENYQQSIEDFKECLRIQCENLDPYDRYLAETHYQLGIAHSFCEEFDNASESFKNAVKVIEGRISKLENDFKKNSSEETESGDPYKIEEEIKELKTLLPEMTEKVSDMSQMKKESIERTKKAVASFASLLSGKMDSAGTSSSFSSEKSGSSSAFTDSNGTAFSSQNGSSVKTVSSISHLVKKKRKPDEDDCANPISTKKTKLENSVGKQNGNSEETLKNISN